MFPLTLPTHWHSIESVVDFKLEPLTIDWLTTQSSLTVRVKELGIAFAVQVLSQQPDRISKCYQECLDTDETLGLNREVLLKQGESALIYAQTIIPNSTLTGSESVLAELGTQSLGQVLFQSPQAIRGQIEFAQVRPESELGQFIEQQLGQPMQTDCYIRRSVFLLNNKPLLVNECFLPALFE